jgi:hypothetical protein
VSTRTPVKEPAADNQQTLTPSRREGGLRAIAENGHVISGRKGAFAIARNDGEILPERDGIRNVSTYARAESFDSASHFVAPSKNSAQNH